MFFFMFHRFLFHKESAAYKQYQQLIEQFKKEMADENFCRTGYKKEEAYEPEVAFEEDDQNVRILEFPLNSPKNVETDQFLFGRRLLMITNVYTETNAKQKSIFFFLA